MTYTQADSAKFAGLPDHCFLLVDGDERALVVRRPDGAVDVPHLRRAVAALHGPSWEAHPRRAELLAEAERLLAEAMPVAPGDRHDLFTAPEVVYRRDAQVADALDALVAGPAHELLPGVMALAARLRERP